MKKQLLYLLFALTAHTVAGSMSAVEAPQAPMRGTVFARNQELFEQYKSLSLALGLKSPALRDQFVNLYGPFGQSWMAWVTPKKRDAFLASGVDKKLIESVMRFDRGVRSVQKRRLAFTGGGALATAAALAALVAAVKYARRGKKREVVTKKDVDSMRSFAPVERADGRSSVPMVLHKPVAVRGDSSGSLMYGPQMSEAFLRRSFNSPFERVQQPTPVRAEIPAQQSMDASSSRGGENKDDDVSLDLTAVSEGRSGDGLTDSTTGRRLSGSSDNSADFSQHEFNSPFGGAMSTHFGSGQSSGFSTPESPDQMKKVVLDESKAVTPVDTGEPKNILDSTGMRHRGGGFENVTPILMGRLHDDDDDANGKNKPENPGTEEVENESFWGAGFRAAYGMGQSAFKKAADLLSPERSGQSSSLNDGFIMSPDGSGDVMLITSPEEQKPRIHHPTPLRDATNEQDRAENPLPSSGYKQPQRVKRK